MCIRDRLTAAAEIVKDLGIKELGFEDEVTVAYHARMASAVSYTHLDVYKRQDHELELSQDPPICQKSLSCQRHSHRRPR